MDDISTNISNETINGMNDNSDLFNINYSVIAMIIDSNDIYIVITPKSNIITQRTNDYYE